MLPRLLQAQIVPPKKSLSMASAASSLAEQHAECPLSFKPLYEGQVAIFVDSKGKRVGTQFYRLDAAEEFIASAGPSATCPQTGQSVAKAKPVPSILEDPKGWFNACDADGNRKLSRDEVVAALKAQLPLNNRAIERFRSDDSAWRNWDRDGSGFIEYVEIMDEDQGILKFIRDSFARITDNRPVPDLRRDREAWFRHWDEDNSGELEFEEVVRALKKSFAVSTAGVAALRESLRAIWCIFDPDGSGSVDKQEFIARDGLADTVLATMDLR